MRVALAQLNPLVGDIRGNSSKILEFCIEASEAAVDLILTPELSLWGYPPQDLLLHPSLLEEQQRVLHEMVMDFATKSIDLSLLVGVAEPIDSTQLPNLFNAIAIVDKSGWRIIARKQLLPTFDVFDEKRYFRPAKSSGEICLISKQNTWKVGITICEDLWVEEKIQTQRIAGPDPIGAFIPKDIDMLINLSASPFSHGKENLRQQLAIKAVKRLNCPVIYLNQVGGNDELIFDGSSFIVNEKSELTLKLPRFREDLAFWDSTKASSPLLTTSPNPNQQLFEALVLGVRDYSVKCGFNSALIGLSGGIDSALVSVIAVAALGADKVSGILMPSPWSSTGSIEDALGLAKRLCMHTETIPISDLMKSYDSVLTKPLNKAPEGLTAENLQSRIRGTILMAIANQNGHLLLATGNKSELAVGYCTLYGDMNGGLAVIGDLYKTRVFSLSKWLDSRDAYACRRFYNLHANDDLIGSAIRKKPPSAELRPDQFDTDSLPPYELLDPILKDLIEERRNTQELIKEGKDPQLIKMVQKLLKKAEFKRRQAPPMLKVSNQAFGSGWRKPIATT